MIYELAKKLKDAGFPEDKFDRVYTGRMEELINDIDGSPTGLMGAESYLAPRLEQLIEACGDEFGGLERTYNYLGNTIEWCAFQTKIDSKDMYCVGPVPEEAVANLWLELNKK